MYDWADLERDVKRFIRGNPELGKLLKFAQRSLEVYEVLYPNGIVAKVKTLVQMAKDFEDMPGADKREWVLLELDKVAKFRKLSEHVKTSIIQEAVNVLKLRGK